MKQYLYRSVVLELKCIRGQVGDTKRQAGQLYGSEES